MKSKIEAVTTQASTASVKSTKKKRSKTQKKLKPEIQKLEIEFKEKIDQMMIETSK